jgi:polyisoprenyl-teichoic acid--peptidoglycan teichoic acid transferase
VRRDPDSAPRLARGLLLRAALAGFLVISLSATAVATTGILEVSRVKDIFTRKGRQAIEIPEVTRAEAGGPRTILMIGSDERFGDKKAGLKARSDTMILARINPRTNGIAVMSIPRDLAVTVPGVGDRQKINSSYESGGARLTVKTIRKFFEDASGQNFPINNVLIVSFGTFRRAVDYIGGVYVDVDRRYFNDNSAGQNFATIDVQPGYQKLMGKDALDYVRYRHTDNDLVRAARQQDFITQARDMAGFKSLLSISDRDRLARAFNRYFRYDQNVTKTKEIFSLLRLGLFLAQAHPAVHKLAFPAYDAPNPAIDTRLYWKRNEIAKLAQDFMKASGTPDKPTATATPSPADQQTLRERRKRNSAKGSGGSTSSVPGLIDARTQGENQAVLADPKLDFPFYFPGLRNSTGAYTSTAPRIYTIRDETGKKHQAYRMVLSKGIAGQYYGVQGMTWKDPPILDNPDERRTVSGRRMSIYKDGGAIRIVAWRTRKAIYWVSNTLTHDLSNRQILAIAGSLRRLRQ